VNEEPWSSHSFSGQAPSPRMDIVPQRSTLLPWVSSCLFSFSSKTPRGHRIRCRRGSSELDSLLAHISHVVSVRWLFLGDLVWVWGIGILLRLVGIRWIFFFATLLFSKLCDVFLYSLRTPVHITWCYINITKHILVIHTSILVSSNMDRRE
jgi:hypothetical protein